MTGEHHDVGSVPVFEVGGAIATGPIKVRGDRLGKLVDSLDDVLNSAETTGAGSAPLTAAELEAMGLGAPEPHPRNTKPHRAAPGAGSAIVSRMTLATWDDGDVFPDGDVD